MTNEELQEQLAGAQYAAAQHLKTVQQQSKIINGMDPRPIPASHRLLPVALHPAIEEALKRYTWMPESAWQDVIAAGDRVSRDAVGGDALSTQVIDHCWAMYQQGKISADHTDKEVFAETLASLATWLAAPERSGCIK